MACILKFHHLYPECKLIEIGKLNNFDMGYFAKCRDELGFIRYKSLKIWTLINTSLNAIRPPCGDKVNYINENMSRLRNSTECKRAINKNIKTLRKRGASIGSAMANTLKKTNKICKPKRK